MLPLMGSKIQYQIAQLSDTLPATIENAKLQLTQNSIGKKLVEKANAPETIKKAKVLASNHFSFVLSRATGNMIGQQSGNELQQNRQWGNKKRKKYFFKMQH